MDEYSTLRAMLELVAKYEDEKDYDQRNECVLHALSAALDVGLPGGLWCDPNEPDWPVVWFELPTGQVSWHLPFGENKWDGHTTEEKYRRISDFLRLNQ